MDAPVTLKKLLDACGSSAPEDWNVLASGPIYRDRFMPVQTRVHIDDPELTYQLQHEQHYSLAAFKPDLSVGIAWGMYADPRLPGEPPSLFEADWATKFPDPKATLHLVDFFYGGSLVDRHHYVHVDSRCKLPMPRPKFSSSDPMEAEITGWTITRWDRDFFRVLNALEANVDYDRYLASAGFEIEP